MSDNSQTKMVVTGASGLLGRAVVKEARNRGYTVVGTAFSRATGNLVKVDLNDKQAIDDFISRERPQAVIHCAAEKRPFAAENNRSAAELLNVSGTKHLAQAARNAGALFVYVSTEYVFDGRNPPYSEDSAPNPLNVYGQTKLDGERVAMQAYPEGTAVLRLPLLYGSAQTPGESPCDALIKLLQENRGKSVEVEAIQKRFPTCVDDVARVLVDIVAKRNISGIFQFAAPEMMTRLDMCAALAQVFGINDVTLVPQKDMKGDGVERPLNAQMLMGALEREGIRVDCVPFKQWCAQHLSVAN
ncbi:hypothetical protein EV177_002946 [Coemansia sp. RSA 1804]|nr:hypothetical protein EV177_002946 [Coemansia sp. RSA 1804]